MDTKKIISAYARFIPHQLIELLGRNEITELRLGDQVEKELTILFTDIRNFTSLSETMTAQENFNFINSFLGQMEPLISVNGGIIDKFIGDAIMAIFPTCASDAYNCATQMLRQLSFYNEGRKRAGYEPIRVGIGLNTGIAILGTVGGFNRMESTVISDAVNTASRIESMTKHYGVDLLMSESTYFKIDEQHKGHIRFIDRTRVKGKQQPLSLYESFAEDAPALRGHKSKTKMLFEEALAHYHLHSIERSAQLLNQVLQDDTGDVPAKFFLEKCKTYASHEPDGDGLDSISWNDGFCIHHEQIDAQHQQLVADAAILATRGTTLPREQLVNLLREFEVRAVAHFAYEEGVMEHAAYPFLQNQKEQHQRFLDRLKMHQSEVLDENHSSTFLAFRTQIFLVDWLITHTLKEDRHLGRFLEHQAQSQL